MARYPSISQAICSRQAYLAATALHFAVAINLLPNYHLIIHWGLTSNRAEPFRALQRFLVCMSKWLKRRDVPIAFIWVRENAQNTSEHVHVVLYCPKEYAADLEAAAANWAGAEDTRAVFLRACENKSYCNVHTLLGYLLKGGDDKVRHAFPVPSAKRHSRDQGTILGKRVGTSRSLGAAAIATFASTQPEALVDGHSPINVEG
jgi:hypothetical protein